MPDICPECHSTITPNYRGACVTCLRREIRRLSAGVKSVEGHGVTLPMQVEASLSDEYRAGYRRGVDSQRWAMRQSMEECEN